MAKPTGGLLAFDAKGQVGRTMVFSKWRGRNYVRRYVVPGNPRTTAQTTVRNFFNWVQQVWKQAPSLVQESWTAAASGKPLTDRNAFTRAEVLAMTSSATDMSNFTFSSGAGGGLLPAGITVTPGASQLTVGVTAPVLPVGWTISEAIAAAIPDQNPQTDVLYESFAGSDSTSPYSIVITGLTTGTPYIVGAWFKFLKPNGSVAYGPMFGGTGTPS